MSRRSQVLVPLAAAALTVIACSRREDACRVDVDCPQGSFCREGLCAALSASDAGADGESPVACVSAGSSCAADTECCSPPCTSGRCAATGGTSGKSSSGTSGTSGASGTGSSTSSGGNCQDLYGLCSFDAECCPGLACTDNGTCR